jgi:hypothetical protein
VSAITGLFGAPKQKTDPLKALPTTREEKTLINEPKPRFSLGQATLLTKGLLGGTATGTSGRGPKLG